MKASGCSGYTPWSCTTFSSLRLGNGVDPRGLLLTPTSRRVSWGKSNPLISGSSGMNVGSVGEMTREFSL